MRMERYWLGFVVIGVFAAIVLVFFAFDGLSAEKLSDLEQAQLELDRAMADLNKAQIDVNLDPRLRAAKAKVVDTMKEITKGGKFLIQQQKDGSYLVLEKPAEPAKVPKAEKK